MSEQHSAEVVRRQVVKAAHVAERGQPGDIKARGAGIAGLREEIAHWLWIPAEDADIIDFCLAVFKSNELPGDPLWGMLIDASGSGKTELLRAFRNLPAAYFLSKVTEKSLVSGYRDPARPKEDPSLLPQLDGKILVIKDLAPLLEMRRESRKAVFAELREAYDGFTDQGRGNMGRVSYQSRFSLLAAATLAVERYDTVEQELGERFIKIRARGDGDRDKVKRALENLGRDEALRSEIEAAVVAFMSSLPDASKVEIRIPADLLGALVELADHTAKARSHVPRDRNGELKHVPRPEVGTRLGKELGKLLVALSLVREKEVPGEAEFSTVRRVAEDCLPPNRLMVLQILREQKKQMTTAEVQDLCDLPRSTVGRVLEDLQVLRAIQ